MRRPRVELNWLSSIAKGVQCGYQLRETNMKLIEALKNLKTIEKRIAKNCASIAQYAAYVSVETPAFETQEKQEQEVGALIQSNLDLEIEYLRLKKAIETTNLAINVSILGKEYTISELITIRRVAGQFRKSTYAALNTTQAVSRMQQFYNKGVDAVNPPRVVTVYNEKAKNKILADWEDFTSAIDGRMEVVNAETELLGY